MGNVGRTSCWLVLLWGLGMGPAHAATRLDTGYGHTCAVTSSGGVRCWGRGSLGQLGGGVTQGYSIPPVAVSGVHEASAVATGALHSCALLTSGRVRCWGLSTYGTLGNGGGAPTFGPVEVSGLTTVVAITAGYLHSCALLADGTARCWGYNADGQLGNNTQTHQSSPVTVLDLSGIVELKAGQYHTCARLGDGTLRCWGAGGSGELGNGANLRSLVPVQVSGISTAVQITAGESASCARLADLSVRCWGWNFFRQLGNDSQTAANTPVTAAISGVVDLEMGHVHTCALLGDGSVRCWGSNFSAQIGPGPLEAVGVPRTIAGLPAGITALSLGFAHSCALRSGGGATCWGTNTTAPLGNGTAGLDPMPAEVQSLTGAVAPSVGLSYHNCAIVSGGAVRCWGKNGSRQLGDGTLVDRALPVDVAGLTEASFVGTGLYHSCALRTDGTVRCWGDNSIRQMGNGGAPHSGLVSPTGLSNVVALAVGEVHNCALLGDATLRCWGGNSDGAVGVGVPSGAISVPTAVAGLSNVTTMGLGAAHSCATTTSGAVHCWGRNQRGQLGQGNMTSSSVPLLVNGISGAAEVRAGHDFTCARLSTGGVRCWGDNDYNQLGVPGQNIGLVPQIPVAGLGPATALRLGIRHACAQVGTGVWCWGSDDGGQLGDPGLSISALPLPVSGLPGLAALGGSAYANCAALSGGAMRCWGFNYDGELGNGIFGRQPVPGPVQGAPFVTWTLRYAAGANGTLTGAALQTVDNGAGGTAVTAVPASGYRFAQWSDASTANPRTDQNVTAAVDVSAQFANTPPTLTALDATPPAIDERESVQVSATATDPESPTLSYAFDCNNDGNFEIGPQAAASASCVLAQPGLRTIAARAIDGPGAPSNVRTVQVQVADSLPIVQFTAPASVQENSGVALAATTTLASSAEVITQVEGDCDYDGQVFTVDVSAATAAQLGNCPGYATGGTRTIALRARDDEPETGPIATRTVDVQAVNDPPQFSVPSLAESAEDAPPAALPWVSDVLPGPADATDESGQQVALEITANSNAALFSSGPALNAAGVLTYTLAPDANGMATITLRACDNGPSAPPNQNCSATRTFAIGARAINDAPALTLGTLPTHPAGTSGVQTRSGFASFDAGPPDEDLAQQILGYTVVVSSDPAGVLTGSPAIANDGTLQYTLSGVGGSASLSAFVRDNGGTAFGGIDQSELLSFTVQVAPGADLEVSIDNGRSGVLPGQTLRYAIIAGNAGPNAVAAARLRTTSSAGLGNPAWTCVQAQSSATCPTPGSGSGALDVLVDLDVGQHLRFELDLSVQAGATGNVTVTADVSPPLGVTALDTSDDSATDSDVVLGDPVFKQGFEN